MSQYSNNNKSGLQGGHQQQYEYNVSSYKTILLILEYNEQLFQLNFLS